jgi:chromosome segregation ATPase
MMTHIRTDNGAVIVKLQEELANANAHLKKLNKYLREKGMGQGEIDSISSLYDDLQAKDAEILEWQQIAVKHAKYEAQADEKIEAKDAEIARLREALGRVQDEISRVVFHTADQWAKKELETAYSTIDQALAQGEQK